MKKSDLDRALGPTPPVFSDRVAQTLLQIKEEPDMKPKHIRRILAVAIIAALLIGAAYALVTTQGQDWYYNNRFTAYKGNEPDKQQAILDNLTTDIPQEQTDTGAVNVTVQDVSWVPEDGIATLSLAARLTNPDKDELHSLMDMDQDGCWSDPIDPGDPESRTEHWLWTDKGCGLPKDMMADPSKRLLLYDDGDATVYIGSEGDVEMPLSSYDPFTGEDGAVISVMEFNLNLLDTDKVQASYDAQTFNPDWGLTQDEWEQEQQEGLKDSLAYAQKTSAAIAANTDENGMLTLRYDYSAIPFADNTILTEEAITGETVFQIKIQ